MCEYVCVCKYLCVYMITLEQNVLIAANSPACYIWIVSDITNCYTCLFSASVIFLLFLFGIVCARMCVSVCVCAAVNGHACYIWIGNDITNSNTCLFSVSFFPPSFIPFSISMCKQVCVSQCVYVCVSVFVSV